MMIRKLKTYHMTTEDIGRYGFKPIDGPMRLVDTEEVKDPKAADAFVCSLPLREHTPPVMPFDLPKRIIEDFGIDERRFVAFDCSDDEWSDHGNSPQAMYVRCNLKPWMRKEMPRSIPWFWPVEDYKECIPVPSQGFTYDVSGHMWLSGGTRKAACESVLDTQGLKPDIAMYPNFTGYVYHLPEGIEKRKKFRVSMQNARVSLCPLSIRFVFPYRFYEAMSAARVPVLICDGAQFPFAEKIPYEQFSLIIPDGEVNHTGAIIKKFLETTSDEQLIKMGQMARHYWETFLNRDNQSQLWTMAITEKLMQDGLFNA